jgi:type III secretion protein J
MSSLRPALLRLALLSAVLLAGCAVPVAGALSDEDANRIVTALEASGVAAGKEPDPEHEARFRVSVAREDASLAVTVLSHENLPPAKATGVLDALGESSIVPSRTAEHAKLVAGTAGDLERSLRAIDGVISARVHLAVPEADALSPEETPREPSASVLVRHRGANPPLSVTDIQRLVAGAVPGLLPAQVNVVATPTPARARTADRELARVGPVTVTRASLLPLKLLVAGAAVLNLLSLGLVVLLWSRLRKTQLALESRPLGDG